MIYDSLDILPIKTFFKIQETNNISLLVTANELFQEDELKLIFDRLSDEFQTLNAKENSVRNFMLLKESSHLEAKFKTAICGIEVLKFQNKDDVRISLCELLNVKIRTNRTDHYYKDLERAENKANLIKKSIQQLNNQLPRKNETKSITIDDTLAAISMITGVSFDFNLISCSAYVALLNQAEQKTKAQEESINKLKNK